MKRALFIVVVLMAVLGIALDRAAACSVCFGDPNSSMAKGAVAGVYVMLCVVGAVLVGMGGTCLFWIQRSRRLVQQGEGTRD